MVFSEVSLSMLTPAALLNHCASYLAIDPKDASDEYVSVLPLPWIMEHVYVFAKALLSRMKVRPTWLFFTSTVLETTNWA